MSLHRLALLALLFSTGLSSLAQHKVNSRNLYERLVLIVPMVGSGTFEDPRRPLLAPRPGEADAGGIMAFSYQLSDDGQYALLELVARDRSVFRDIIENGRGARSVFERGKHRKDDIVREFRKFKKNFDPDHFGMSVD